MNPNTMTIEAIRDELARVSGYVRGTRKGQIRYGIAGPGCAFLYTLDEIIPATLDEAAKLPAPWKLGNMILWADNRIIVEAIWPQCENRPIEAVGDTEMEARFRLRLACTLADEGSKT